MARTSQQQRGVAAPLSPPFPRSDLDQARRPTSSFRVVAQDDVGAGHGSWLSPSAFAAAQREAHRRLAAQEEAKYEQVRRATEQRALDSLKTVGLVEQLAEPGVSRSTMKQVALKGLRPLQYASDVLPERQGSNLCGYPACSSKPRRPAPATPSTAQWQLDYKTHLFVDFREQGKFCSERCWKRSQWYASRVLGRESAAWRGDEGGTEDDPDLVLLEEVEERGVASRTPDTGVSETIAESVPRAFSNLVITERQPADDHAPRPPSPSQDPPTESTDTALRRKPLDRRRPVAEPSQEESDGLAAALALRNSLRASGDLA